MEEQILNAAGLHDDLAALGALPPADPQLPPPTLPSSRFPILPRFGARTPSIGAIGLGLIVLSGAFGDIALRTGLTSVASTVAVVGVVIVLVRLGAVAHPTPRALCAAAIVTAAWLPLRSSPWLVSMNGLTIVGLLLAAVAVGPLSIWRLHPVWAGPLARRVLMSVRGPQLLLSSARDLVRLGSSGTRVGSGRSFVRGIAVALIPLVPIVVLLASADAVFASMLRVPFDAGSLVGHILLTALVAISITSLCAVGLGPHAPGAGSYRRRLGATEATVALIGIISVFSIFAMTQMITALGGAQHIIETANLTRAEYARQGFFQLLAVSVITLAVLFVVRIFVPTDDARVNFRLTLFSTLASLLTMVIVAVSIIRLALYIEAFGLTMLRLHSMLFAALIGVTFLLYVGHLMVPASRLWFVPALTLVAWGLLMGLNGLNPEGFVVDWNAEHRATIHEFDAPYAAELSSDAVGAMAKAVAGGELQPSEAEAIRSTICAHDADASQGWGVLGWSRSRAEVQSAQALIACG